MKYYFSLFFCLMIFNSACTKSSDASSVSSDSGTTTYTYPDNESMLGALSNFSLSCATGSDCPQNLGALIIKMTDVSFAECTFSLIDQDTVLTNRHCIPDDIAYADASCTDRLMFLFYSPTSPLGRDLQTCDKIISLPSEYNTDMKKGRDFAIVKLKPQKDSSLERKALRLNTIGVSDGELLTAHVVAPDAGSLSNSASLKKVQCQVVMGAMINPSFQQSTDAVMTLKNCPLIHGDSGSPLTNSNNEVVGVVQAGILDSDSSSNFFNFESGYSQSSLQNELKSKMIAGQFAYATQALCFDVPGQKISPKSNCVVTHESEQSASKGLSAKLLKPEEIQAHADSFVAEYNQSSDIIEWQAGLKSNDNGLNDGRLFDIVLIPKCLKGSFHTNTWMKHGKKTPSSGRVELGSSDIPSLQVLMKINDDLKFELDYIKTSTISSVALSWDSISGNEDPKIDVFIDAGTRLPTVGISGYGLPDRKQDQIGFCQR